MAVEIGKATQLNVEEIMTEIRNLFANKQINQREVFAIYVMEKLLVLKITIDRIEAIDAQNYSTFGQVTEDSQFKFKIGVKSKTEIRVASSEIKQMFKADISFEKLGIGGLDDQFATIFRRAFNSRRYPQSIIEKYGLKHCKGMVLHGPPGTGKTLIARQIAKSLNCQEPQIVNGPEIFDKYVGGSEKKIRELFAPAEAEQQDKGDESELHIIIFDEIDAICKSRGSATASGSNVNDSVVNQLLSKLDGVEALNNILVIGMTNRLDMIDEAILRPGRLELHLEIGLPDTNGRRQIFGIHTGQMSKNNLLSSDVDLDKLAEKTKNYTGAEIESVCRSANSYALFGYDAQKSLVNQISNKPAAFEEKMVTMKDFLLALEEVKPSFGVDDKSLENSFRGGIYNHGSSFAHVYSLC